MAHQKITDILRNLHSSRGHPRLEIEGAGEPSIEAQYLTWIKHKKEGEGETAIYVIQDWYEDTSYVTEYRTECIKLPKSGIESLVEYALSTNSKALIHTKGKHIKHNERWDDYSGSHDGSPVEVTDILVELSLELLAEKPIFSVHQLPYIPYPDDLPAIAVANREALCINCEYVWLEPFGGRDPDFNHCVQMDSTREAINNLKPPQMERFKDLVGKGVLCPVFDQTTRYSK